MYMRRVLWNAAKPRWLGAWIERKREGDGRRSSLI